HLPLPSPPTPRPPTPTPFPYTTLFRSPGIAAAADPAPHAHRRGRRPARLRHPRRREAGPAEGRLAGRRLSDGGADRAVAGRAVRSEEHTSELQSPYDLVCRLLLEKKKI